MSTKVDARGLSCPQPVLMTMTEIKKMSKGEIVILVDTDTSRENVTRAATSQGWQVEVKIVGEDYCLVLKKE
jgi:tRNA 2-thiouridine synthesizing protein A